MVKVIPVHQENPILVAQFTSMKDKNDLRFDGISIYLSSTLVSSLAGKIILAICNLIAWAFFIMLLILIPISPGALLGIGVFLAFLILVVGRFTAWNFWGKEYVRISLKSISYVRSYWIISIPEKTIRINRLYYQYSQTHDHKGAEYGKLEFFDYDENDYPTPVFETGIPVAKPVVEEILNTLELMQNKEDLKVSGIIQERISLN